MRFTRKLLEVFVAASCYWRTCAGETAEAVATVTADFVSRITVISGGSGYVTEPSVTISGGGGYGATAKAVLNGDSVGAVVVVDAGVGYTNVPVVTIAPPPLPLALSIRAAPVITVIGQAGTLALVQWSDTSDGPWEAWTNTVIPSQGVILVDLSAGAFPRFYRAVRPTIPNGFLRIGPGSFLMGSPLNEVDRFASESQHEVALTREYWMASHEVTQVEYESVMGSNPSYFKGANLPVEQVTWTDAQEYCRKLTTRDRASGQLGTGQEYRLPTEAQWEYACRAGTTTATAFGESLSSVLANFNGGAPYNGGAEGVYLGRSAPVGSYAPNTWGLYDFHGNVWEWCADWYGPYPTGRVENPEGPSSGDIRVVRGGSWIYDGSACRSAERNALPSSRSLNYLGFRVAIVPVE